MSLFSWFTRTSTRTTAAAPDSSSLGHVDATVPVLPAERFRVKLAPPPGSHPATRKTERLERREHVYSVVRDSMIRAGVLAANYKFKVLSLDVSGQQYLIMMDLTNQSAGDTARLAEIEALIAQAAKMRHDLLVTAVYWRVNAHVTAGLSHAQPASRAHALKPSPEGQVTRASTPPSSPASRHEPLQPDEVAAFKRSLASAAPAVPLAASGQIVTSGRRNPAPPVEFEDTQMVEPSERASPLSATQYGELN